MVRYYCIFGSAVYQNPSVQRLNSKDQPGETTYAIVEHEARELSNHRMLLPMAPGCDIFCRRLRPVLLQAYRSMPWDCGVDAAGSEWFGDPKNSYILLSFQLKLYGVPMCIRMIGDVKIV